MREQCDHLFSYRFELRKAWTQRHEFTMAPTEYFALFSVEAKAIDAVAPHILRGCELTIERSDRPELRIELSLITVNDTVLEARLRRMEGFLDAILRTDMDENSDDAVEARMAQRRGVLRRLGYKPAQPLDHRRLYQPILFGGTERAAVVIRCDDTLPEKPAEIQVVLRGMRKRPVS
jgi:hypothetical protein